MYQERIRDLGESKLTARKAVGAVLDINPATLRNWAEREEIDSGARPGVTTEASDELKALRREVAELRRANEILKTPSAVFAAAGLDPPPRWSATTSPRTPTASGASRSAPCSPST